MTSALEVYFEFTASEFAYISLYSGEREPNRLSPQIFTETLVYLKLCALHLHTMEDTNVYSFSLFLSISLSLSHLIPSPRGSFNMFKTLMKEKEILPQFPM
jgi:hypothetical protein